MNRFAAPCALLLLAVLAAGCASDPVFRKYGEPPTPAPWRTLLLPVTPASPAEGKEVPDIDIERLEETRACLAIDIPRGPYRLVALPRVDRALSSMEGPLEGKEAMARAGQALGADLVIQPELFAWKRRYYFIHSVARVGLRVKIHDGRTGRLLGESSHERVRNQGILKIPLGYGGAVYGPIRGLLHGQMSLLCDDVAELIGDDLAAFPDAELTEGSAAGESSETPPREDKTD